MAVLLFASHSVSVHADEIVLVNQDRITGKILENTQSLVIIQSEILGPLSIDKKFVKNVIGPHTQPIQEEAKDPEKKKEVEWDVELQAGYDRTAGNTKTQEGSGEVFINRRRPKVDEYTLRAKTFISSRDGKMNARRHNGSIRYAFSFGARKKWHNFYKFEAFHDRFANIDSRLTPTSGIGYWFSDKSGWKWLAELGIGAEHTRFRDTTEDRTEFILAPRVFAEVKIWPNGVLTEDLSWVPSLSEGEYRIVSETALTSDLNDSLALRLSLTDEYNSNPAEDAKKNDLRLTSAIVYSL